LLNKSTHVETKVYVKPTNSWMDNRTAKDKEKTTKYAALRWELKQQYPGYEVKQYNVIIDVLGGWSEDVEAKMKELVGEPTN